MCLFESCFLCLFSHQLHGFAENVQAVFGDRLKLWEFTIAQFGFKVFAAMCVGDFNPNAMGVGGSAEQEGGCDKQSGFFQDFSPIFDV